jgi:3-hydroxyacyl-CoA dehydrogenase
MLISMVKNGEFGASSGKGFYDWSDPRHPRARKLSRYIIDSAEDMTGQIK